MQEQDERARFLDCVWAELGVDPHQINLVGTGHNGQVYQISEHLCVKIGKNPCVIAVPESLRNCENLAIPQ